MDLKDDTRAVAVLTAKGCTNAEISEELDISETSVKRIKMVLCREMDVPNMTSAIALLVQRGVITVEDEPLALPAHVPDGGAVAESIWRALHSELVWADFRELRSMYERASVKGW